jgi:mono/diheme cytochrome c family protein
MIRDLGASCRCLLISTHSGLAAGLLLAVLGCASESGSDTVARRAEETETAAQQAPASPAPSGPVDHELAERGESLFRAKGCNGCHTIGGGRLTGPDLAGVTERREFGWTLAMITKPDSMIKADPTARQLFAEYMTPMLNMNITPDEARAIYEYLRGEGEDEDES